MPFTPFGLPPYVPWTPNDDGFLGSNFDPAGASGGGLLVAGTLYLARLPIRAPTTITNLWYGVSVAGAGASTGSFVGLYSPAGVLLSGSADQGATFAGATGYHPAALTTPQALAGGPGPSAWPFAAVLCNLATTQVTLVRAFNTPNASPQVVVTPATMRWGSFAAQGTALPASVNLSTMATTSFTNIFPWN